MVEYKNNITFAFKDLDTGKKYKVRAKHPDEAIMKLNNIAKKEVNYTFLGRFK